MSVVLSLFLCDMATGCSPESDVTVCIVRNLFAYPSVMNLCSLVLDRYIAIVNPLKYFTFMKRHRVIQMVFLSWTIPVTLLAIFATQKFLFFKMLFLYRILMSLFAIFFEFLPSAMLIFCFASMLHVVCKHNREARSLAKQLRFNHEIFVKTQEKSAIIMMGIVIGLFLLCYGIQLHCTFFVLFNGGQELCHDIEYKIPVLVLNSAINPLAYSFFKRDIKNEIKRRICCAI